jgi:NADP-dependent 3-hydroxy acid dehydrogenase YdfG
MASQAEPLAGRSALVTGASGGIGAACARRLLEAGARVLVSARRADVLGRLAAELGAEAVPADLATTGGADLLAHEVAQRLGTAPDILVNAAGAFRLAPIADTSAAEFDEHIAVNLAGPFLLIRAFLPDMLGRGTGHVVSIGSIAGRHAFPNNGAYSASKFGLRGLHAVLDAELRGTGVRATLVEPAATDTTLWHAIDRTRNPGLPAADQMLAPDDVADAVLFALTRPAAVDIRNLILERA